MDTATNITRLAAWFGAAGGGAPDYSEPPSAEWSVDRIDESDPAHPVAYLTRALTGFPVDRTAIFETREVHIWGCDIGVPITDEDYRVTPLFWGTITANSISIRAGETETAVAMVHRFHYGTPLEGEQVWDPDAEDVLIVNRDARFNPEIDSKIAGNMAPARDGHASMPETHNLWLDPESCRTEEAAAVHDQAAVADTWSLGLAVETLQRVLNADETYLTNVEVFEDPDVPEAPFDNSGLPENIRLKRGLYLDQCLDTLLPQYGCGYFLRVTEDDTPGHADRFIAPEIAYYQRGVGTEKDVKLQAFGNHLQADDTNCLDALLTFDIANMINRVVVHGHPVEREVTLELHKGWDADHDALTADELTRGVIDSDFETYPAVHRLWIANEDGSYTDLRTEITEALDLSSVFDAGYAPKRRKLYPPITYRNPAPNEDAGLRAPVKVEFSLDDGGTWLDVTGEEANARFVVTEDQIGIYFNQPAPPEVFVTNVDELRMRVTGTIVGDLCLIGEADVPAWAANQDPVSLVVDAGDRYFDRARASGGDHDSVLTGAHDSRDDQTAITAFAESLRDQEAAASVTARLTLSGIVTDYAISDLLTGISGRNISFNRSGEPETPLYVQVVGRVFNGVQQTTTLLVAPYDIPRSSSSSRGMV